MGIQLLDDRMVGENVLNHRSVSAEDDFRSQPVCIQMVFESRVYSLDRDVP